jgi:hypothetical protein
MAVGLETVPDAETPQERNRRWRQPLANLPGRVCRPLDDHRLDAHSQQRQGRCCASCPAADDHHTILGA